LHCKILPGLRVTKRKGKTRRGPMKETPKLTRIRIKKGNAIVKAGQQPPTFACADMSMISPFRH
jgi:hypothetical protein